MEDNRGYSEFRGTVIATLESLNHNDDVLNSKINAIKDSLTDCQHCAQETRIGYESRITKLETNQKIMFTAFVAALTGIVGLAIKLVFL